MKQIKHIILVVAILSLGATGCKKYNDETPSIAGIAVAGADFSTLEDAAVLGGVAGVLSNKNANHPSGNYTVFAPNNAAFAKLGLVDGASLGALQSSFLTNTLLYHTSNGDIMGSTIMAGASSPSVTNIMRRYIVRGSDKYINGSKILATDVKASNGTVHVIDKVILGTGVNIVASAQLLSTAKVFKTAELTFLVAAVVKSGLAPVLADPANNFTIYAPTDAAFKAAGFATVADVSNAPAAVLQAVLLNHAIPNGKFTSEYTTATASTAGGGTLNYGSYANGVYTIKSNGITTAANMVIPDIMCSNGVVHLIDKVLLP